MNEIESKPERVSSQRKNEDSPSTIKFKIVGGDSPQNNKERAEVENETKIKTQDVNIENDGMEDNDEGVMVDEDGVRSATSRGSSNGDNEK